MTGAVYRARRGVVTQVYQKYTPFMQQKALQRRDERDSKLAKPSGELSARLLPGPSLSFAKERDGAGTKREGVEGQMREARERVWGGVVPEPSVSSWLPQHPKPHTSGREVLQAAEAGGFCWTAAPCSSSRVLPSRVLA